MGVTAISHHLSSLQEHCGQVYRSHCTQEKTKTQRIKYLVEL